MKRTLHAFAAMELLKLFLFAAAFGYVEGAVAHYLRLHYYPTGFEFRLSDLGSHNTLPVEIGREAATLIMLATVAAMTRGAALRRFANFVYIFAVWDIFYYCALFLFEKWPQNLFSWDVLFLIPVPWFAPVLAPVVISMLGICGAVYVNISTISGKQLKTGFAEPLLICAAFALWLASFLMYPQKNTFPEAYHWPLFAAGTISVIAAYAVAIKKNLKEE